MRAWLVYSLIVLVIYAVNPDRKDARDTPTQTVDFSENTPHDGQ